jgi:hypothetical protein
VANQSHKLVSFGTWQVQSLPPQPIYDGVAEWLGTRLQPGLTQVQILSPSPNTRSHPLMARRADSQSANRGFDSPWDHQMLDNASSVLVPPTHGRPNQP